MNNKIGRIQMKKGKWKIYTYFAGFRPQWMILNEKFICERIKQWQGISHHPLLIARSNIWVKKLKLAKNKQDKKKLFQDKIFIFFEVPIFY